MDSVRRLARIFTTPVAWFLGIMSEPALLVMWVLLVIAIVHIAADAAMWLL